MTVQFLCPRQVAGYPIDYHPATPKIGRIEVIIWRDARRDDGFMIRCTDWSHVRRLLTDINAVMEVRK